MSIKITKEVYDAHRNIATQINTLYIEIEKLAKKKATEFITSLISRKINHVIKKTKELIKNDEFLDAIETIPDSDIGTRYDEALIVLGELKSAMNKQWESEEWRVPKRDYGQYQNEIIG